MARDVEGAYARDALAVAVGASVSLADGTDRQSAYDKLSQMAED